MKTLDETIDNIETCQKYSTCISCPYCGFNECKSKWGRDALHYLKEYRDLKSTIDWHEEMEEIRRSLTNNPLTWNELKQMTGKPVWVEFFFEDGQHFVSDWFLVYSVSESFCDVTGKLGTSRLLKNDYWKAYRKEYHEDVG